MVAAAGLGLVDGDPLAVVEVQDLIGQRERPPGGLVSRSRRIRLLLTGGAVGLAVVSASMMVLRGIATVSDRKLGSRP